MQINVFTFVFYSGITEGLSDDPLLVRLSSIVQHQESMLQKECAVEDWHMVAVIIDRYMCEMFKLEFRSCLLQGPI